MRDNSYTPMKSRISKIATFVKPTFVRVVAIVLLIPKLGKMKLLM